MHDKYVSDVGLRTNEMSDDWRNECMSTSVSSVEQRGPEEEP